MLVAQSSQIIERMGIEMANGLCKDLFHGYLRDYSQWHGNVSRHITSNEKRLRAFKCIYKYLPFVAAVLYLVLMVYAWLNLAALETLKLILVPGILFVLVSLLRKAMNLPRPYTKYNIQPIMTKDKVGESFPSRHTFSITIIAMAWLYVYPPVGMLLWLMSIVLGAVRVLAGVHFIKDVAGAALISIVFGGIGLFLL